MGNQLVGKMFVPGIAIITDKEIEEMTQEIRTFYTFFL